jgi:hypothetical protein
LFISRQQETCRAKNVSFASKADSGFAKPTNSLLYIDDMVIAMMHMLFGNETNECF